MVELTKVAITHTPAPYGDLASWAVGRPMERAGAGELGQAAGRGPQGPWRLRDRERHRRAGEMAL